MSCRREDVESAASGPYFQQNAAEGIWQYVDVAFCEMCRNGGALRVRNRSHVRCSGYIGSPLEMSVPAVVDMLKSVPFGSVLKF